MTDLCGRCGIGIHWMRVGRPVPTGALTAPIERGYWLHDEPRTLENNLHNGSPDHDAVGPTPTNL